jgi:hypothetical protein
LTFHLNIVYNIPKKVEIMHKVIKINVLENYRLDLTFADGTRGTADLSDLAGSGVFKCWDNYEEFKMVKIGDAGELVWREQIDLCPDALYLRVTGKTAEDIFPALKHVTVYA